MAKDYNGNIEDEPVMFTESSVLENVVTGETLKVIIGKIKKLFNPTTGHDHDGTNSKKIAASNVDGLADYFNKTTGHDHDGTDSKKILYANVDSKPALANTNMLLNWDWRTPINQRSATGAVSNAYCIDRWIGNGTVTPSAGSYVTLANATTMIQRMEILPNNLLGKDCVFSVMIDGTISSAVVTFPSAVSGSADTGTITDICGVEVGFFDLGSGNTSLLCQVASRYIPYIKITASAEINVQAVKLEIGSISTLNYDKPADYGNELSKCQRYYQIGIITISQGDVFNNTWAFPKTLFPVIMRISPTTTYTSVTGWSGKLSGSFTRSSNWNYGFENIESQSNSFPTSGSFAHNFIYINDAEL